MTDAINAKSDVLGDRELDAVSGGMGWLPIVVAQVIAMIEGRNGGTGAGRRGGSELARQRCVLPVLDLDPVRRAAGAVRALAVLRLLTAANGTFQTSRMC